MKNKQMAAEGGSAPRKGTSVGTWRLGEVLHGAAAPPYIAATHSKYLNSSKMTQRPSPEERRRPPSSEAGDTAGPGPPPRRFISRAAPDAQRPPPAASTAAAAPRVRTTRASRLRTAATASSDSSPNAETPLDGSFVPGAGAAAAAAAAGAAARTRRLGAASSASSAAPAPRRSAGSSGSSTEKQTASVQSDSGPRREKDKSSKRKSNLNRWLAAEAVPPTALSDETSCGGSLRRRRRPLNGVAPPGPPCDAAPPASRHRPSLDASVAASPVSGSPRHQQQHSRLNGTTSTVVPVSPARNTASPSCIVRTSPPKTLTSGFTPTAVSRKNSSPLVAPSKLRYLPRDSDAEHKNTLQKVAILTALTKESLERLDKLTNTSLNEECSAQVHGEPPISLSSTIVSLSNGHSENSVEVGSPKQFVSSAVSVDTHSSSPSVQEVDIVVEAHERSKSPTKPASSILKKKSPEDQQVAVVQPVPVATAQPVSILKRKTSQDEAGSASNSTPAQPVTFSPSVEDHIRNSRRQGILKKRASLDESEVVRRRSCSPDVNHSWARYSYEFRPILKNQRRSSMEELVRRTQSPDLQPHSILKRKTSRDDDPEERTTSPEPQGILKRKSNMSSSSSSGSGSPHVSISQTVLMNVVGISNTEISTDTSENVRPILKKKSSSEDTTTADSSSADTPRPILKKKTSVDVDDLEDRPKKPILKSRKSSQESRGSVSLDGTPRESPTRCLKIRSHSATASDSTSGSDGEAVKPILKQSSSRERSSSPRPRLSFCDDDDRFTGRSNASSGSESTHPASPVRENAVLRRSHVLCSPISFENDQSNTLFKRRSWEPGSQADDIDKTEPKKPSDTDDLNSLSVAERILNMENLLSQPTRDNSNVPTTGAVPKRQGLARSLRNKERFHTQPVTMDELEASAMLARSDDFHKSFVKTHYSSDRPVDQNHATGDIVGSSTDESPSADTSVPDSLDNTLASTPSPAAEGDKHFQQLVASSNSVDGKSFSGPMEPAEENMPNGSSQLTKSCSVSAMASIFAKREEEASRSTSVGVSRYRERRRLWAGDSRVATQPVTQNEVEEAVRLNTQQTAQSETGALSSSVDDDGNEDDPSKLSLGERIRLFNQKIKDEQIVKSSEPGPRVTVKRSARFKTQPVTNEEVETAQKKISNLAASFAKPPDPEILGGLSIRAAREKIYEHATQILSKSSSATHLGQNSASSSDIHPGSADGEAKPKGILKHSDSQKAEILSSEEATGQESESEVKGILKTPTVLGRSRRLVESENSRHLKGVLKKETSAEECCGNTDIVGDHPKSILKPKAKEWVDQDELSLSGSDQESLDSDSEKPAASANKRGIDLVSILHDVEEQARQQRQQASRQNCADKVKNMNKRLQEKENRALDGEERSYLSLESKTKEENLVHHRKLFVNKDITNGKLSPGGTEESTNSSLTKQISITSHRNNVSKREISTDVNSVRRELFSEHSSTLETVTPHTSDGETSSSGGREVKRIIRNEAVARRRQIAISRQNRSGASSLPPAGPALCKSRSQPCVQQPAAGLQRSSTQPMAADLHALAGASIADRLAALQKSGDTQWRKRITHLNPEDEISIIATKNQINELQARRRDADEADDAPAGASVLAERLGRLDAATQGWRKRVGPTDADRFSVAGRMRMRGGGGGGDEPAAQPCLPPQLQGGSPSDKAARRVPRAVRFRSKAAQIKNASSTPTSPQKESPASISFKRSLSAPGGDEENGFSGGGKDDEHIGPTVTVPRADDETFLEFFRSISTEKLQSDRLEIKDEDLNQIIQSSTQLLVQKRSVKVQRRNITSRNPIKALAARTDLQEEYVEVKSGIAEKEIRRLNVEKLAKSSPLAIEALAGLASKEDFTAVALKKASHSFGSMAPHKELMLIHVKGRRHVQSRLVEPVVTSINHGDNYVLVTPTEVYNWIGLYSNVIERSRGAEIAQNIVQKKDLGYTSSGQVITISQEKVTCSTSQKKRFWKLLGAKEDSEEAAPAYAGHPDEDELYENCIIATNKAYELQDHELVPMEEYWGSIPRIQMLDPSKILVFDFGSEMYIWNGKNASMEDRREAAQLTRELWSEGYDYTGCDVCPLTISGVLGSHLQINESSTMSAPIRPSWALLGKVTQHMETILFREKFLDWPDFSRVIRSKVNDDVEKQVDASIDIKPCDVKQMIEVKPSSPDLELEGLHLGRGKNYFNEELRRHYEITTLGVTVWHIQEYEHSQLPESSVGQFHMGDSYVIRWQYSITITGRELNGQPSRHSVTGRDRCAYFCWQGQDASLNEQGAAALLTVELDHERGPQVRVVQGYEPPAFLALFQGKMITHSGRRGNPDISGPWRLFLCRGELPQEAVLVEVTCSIRQLRNRGCFVLLNTSTGAVHVWYGKKSPEHTRKIAKSAAERIRDIRPPEIGFKAGVDILICEQCEGNEKRELFQGLGGSNRQLYVSVQASGTPRLFHLSSLSGSFEASEVLSPYRHPEYSTVFPFLQDDLYSANQPALFLLDSGSELWLWQGWWPDTTEEPSTQTGSGAVRWQAERRAAMQTALDYGRHTGRRKASAWLVWAGLEPLEFTNLFPMWTDRDDIAELNITDGRKPGEVLTVEDELARLTCSTYPPALLLQRPLPDGVDPTCLENYLDPQHYQELLGMSKEEFVSLPSWKQAKLKKDVGLF